MQESSMPGGETTSEQQEAHSRGMASAARRVLHTEDILLNIFKHLDDDHWGDYFLVEKAWLPVITKHRCRDLKLSGLPWCGTYHDPRILEWREESAWHHSVTASLRTIHAAWRSKGYSAPRFDRISLLDGCELFKAFPALQLFGVEEIEEHTGAVKASATWTFDHNLNTGTLAVHRPHSMEMPDFDPDRDFDFAQIDFRSLAEDYGEDLPPGWTASYSFTLHLELDDTAEDSYTQPTPDANLAFLYNNLETSITGLALDECPATIDDFGALLRVQKHYPGRCITRVAGNKVHPFTPAEFRDFAKNFGAPLVDCHMFMRGDEGYISDMALSWQPSLSLRDLASVVETIINYLPRLRTITIAVEEVSVDAGVDLRLAKCTPRKAKDCLAAVHLQLVTMQSSYDLSLPLLRIAFNLCHVADHRTAITVRHYDELDEIDYRIEHRSEEASAIHEVITFLRSLPDRHMMKLLGTSLTDLHIRPDDWEAYTQITFRPDGSPIPRNVQLHVDRVGSLRSIWKNVEGPMSDAAASSTLACRKAIRAAGADLAADARMFRLAGDPDVRLREIK